MIDDHLRKVASTYKWDWDERLPIFLLAYRASIHETTGVTPAIMAFGQELHLPCCLMFGAPSDKEQSTTDYAADIVKWLHDIHQIALQHLKGAETR